MQRGLKTLSEIALKKNPLQQVDYLDLLISSEKSQARPGWKDRVDSLIETTKRAERSTNLLDQIMTPGKITERTKQHFNSSKSHGERSLPRRSVVVLKNSSQQCLDKNN